MRYVSSSRLIVCGLATSSLAKSALGAAITVGTTGLYASGGGLTPANAPSYTGQVALSQFTSDIAAAFAANTGGDVNFDTGFTAGANVGDGPSNPITANFGSSGLKSLAFYRTDADPTNSTGNGSLYFALSPNNNNGTDTTSGSFYLGVQTQTSPVTIGFGTGLSELGLSFVPRSDGSSRTVTMVANLDNGTMLTGSQTTANTSNGAFFYGFEAPAGRTITSLRITADNYARFDDLGFVVAPIPEPASVGLLFVGGLATFVRRRV